MTIESVNAHSWWDTIPAAKRYELMKKHDIKTVTMKGLLKMYRNSR